MGTFVSQSVTFPSQLQGLEHRTWTPENPKALQDLGVALSVPWFSNQAYDPVVGCPIIQFFILVLQIGME